MLWRAWRDGPIGSLVWLFAIIALIAVVNRRVFWERSVPTFPIGMAGVVGRRSGL